MDFTKMTDEELQKFIKEGSAEIRKREKEKEDKAIEQFFKAWENVTNEGLGVYWDGEEIFPNSIEIY